MRFWDSSAIVPLVMPEASSTGLRALIDSDENVLVWWAGLVECQSAISRGERLGQCDLPRANSARRRLSVMSTEWDEVQPSAAVRDAANRLLRVHRLSAADALQLGAALSSGGSHAPSLEFVCLDERLRTAASREGFTVLP